MKPIQQHKDPRIANISLDNFTGTICIITPISNEDDETKDLMLSSPRTNTNNDIFNPNHHLTLITQPILGARSRKKNHVDSVTSTRRTSFNHSPSLVLPIHQIKGSEQEKKINHYESTDSGIDLSSSTNSSVQFPQQQQHIHRPLSALNEDSSTDDQSIQIPIINLGRNRSLENILNSHTHESQQQKNRSSSFSDERDKIIKKSNDSIHLTTITEQINLNPNQYFQSPRQQYRSLHDIPSVNRKSHLTTLKPITKKPKLNIIIQPFSHIDNHDEQIGSVTRTTSSSSNGTTTHLIKPKAITPLGNYPNQEQIRAHINRSVIERQHPSYLTIPSTQRDSIQHKVPFDKSPSKINHLSTKQQLSPRHIKQTLPVLYPNEDIIHNRQEKRKKRVNDLNKSQEQIINKHENNQKEHFLTSTPRDNPNRQRQIIIKPSYPNSIDKKPKYENKKQNINRRQQPHPVDPIYESQSNKNRIIHRKIEYEHEYSPRNTLIPIQTRPTKLIRIPNNQHEIEQKSPIESINNLLQTTRIHPTNSNNTTKKSTKESLYNNANRFFQSRSPTSWSVISDHQINQQHLIYETSSSSSSSSNHDLIDNPLTRTYRISIHDDDNEQQQPIDGRYVIPSDNQLPLLMNSPSQTSSHHTYPFTYTPDSEKNSPCELIAPNNSQYIFNRENDSSSSSLEQFCPNDRFPLPLGKVTVAMKEDDISTNYDSDDGWSNDSAELIYIDEHYAKQKKKSIKNNSSSSSSSHLISKQHSHLQ